MGIAWLLLQRTFSAKPKRTLLFLIGYALATAVMVTLLAVGEAVLQQARDKDLLGGGDLILVPAGIDLESMKVGGISALYYSIPEARFIVRQMLNSSRFQNEIDSISPYIVPKVVYLRTGRDKPPPYKQNELSRSTITVAFAEGSFPDQENRIKNSQFPWHNNSEDQAWLHPAPSDFYHEIDHFHLPSMESPDMRRWEEWHYFNFESKSFYGYLSIMVAGNILANDAHWIVSLQMYDEDYGKYSAIFPASKESLPLKLINYRAGTNYIRFVKDHYEIDLNFRDRLSVQGHLRYYPNQGLYVPPTFLARSKNFESGYTIPAIRGKYEGKIQIGKKTYDFNNINGYHDHNWGIWGQIDWNWGHAFSKEFAIFFGEIFLNHKSKGLFVGVYDSKGFVSMFRPDKIRFSNYQNAVPLHMEMQSSKRFSSFHMIGGADRFVTTPLEDQQLDFVQYKMNYNVKLKIDNKEYDFLAKGNAETFVKSRVLE
jgi:hypothetical protein